MSAMIQRLRSYFQLRSSINQLSESHSSLYVSSIIDIMIASGNNHSHLWKKLAGQMEDNQPENVSEVDTIDLAHQLEWIQKTSLGTEPIKG